MAMVDVIVPVFNTRLHFLAAALKSLREQTLSDWSAWIIDDCSEKSYSLELEEHLRSYDDPRIKFLRAEQHMDASGSRNVAIRKGQARYVAFLDSDDRWMPHHLSRQVALLDANDGIALAHGNSEIIDPQGQLVRRRPPRTGLNELSIAQSFVCMARENFVVLSSVVLRRSVLERVDSFDETFPMLADKELWLRLLNIGARFHYDPETCVQYRVHPENTSKKTDLQMATRRRIIEKAEGLLHRNAQLEEIDWPSLKREMERHMYSEAAEGYLEQGRYTQALKYGSPFYSGFSRHSCVSYLRFLFRAVWKPGNHAKSQPTP